MDDGIVGSNQASGMHGAKCWPMARRCRPGLCPKEGLGQLPHIPQGRHRRRRHAGGTSRGKLPTQSRRQAPQPPPAPPPCPTHPTPTHLQNVGNLVFLPTAKSLALLEEWTKLAHEGMSGAGGGKNRFHDQVQMYSRCSPVLQTLCNAALWSATCGRHYRMHCRIGRGTVAAPQPERRRPSVLQRPGHQCCHLHCESACWARRRCLPPSLGPGAYTHGVAVTGSREASVVLWDLQAGAQLQRRAGHVDTHKDYQEAALICPVVGLGLSGQVCCPGRHGRNTDGCREGEKQFCGLRARPLPAAGSRAADVHSSGGVLPK